MAAGFLITRIALVCFLSEVTYSSVFPSANLGDPKALQDGQKKGLRGFGTRRPLHYIRALRRSSKSAQVEDQRHAPVQKQSQTPYQPQTSPPQRNYTTAKPRAFELNLAVPIFDLLNQNKGTGSTIGMSHRNHGADSKYSQSFPIPNINILGNRGSTKDPYKGETGHGEKPNFQLSLSVPLQATSQKPPQNSGGHFDLKPENLHVQTKLTEPERKLGSTQTGLKWPFLDHAGRREQAQWPTALKLPIANNIVTRNQKTQPHELIRKQPTDGKLILSSWPYSQPTNFQQLKQGEPNQDNWAFQKPAINDPPSLMLQLYPDPVDLNNANTNFPRQRYENQSPNVQPNPTQLLLSLPPQGYDRVPSEGSHFHIDGQGGINLNDRPSSSETQSSLNIHGLLNKGPVKDPKGGKPGYESSRSNFQLSISVPIPAKSPNITKISSRHSDIKFETSSDGSGYMKPLRQLGSVQIGSNWPNANFDSMHQQTDLKSPVLHHDAGHQYAQQHVPSKSTDGRLTHSPWRLGQHASSQNSQDKPTENWAFQSPSINKPPSPVLPLPTFTRHEGYGASTRPRKFEDQNIREPSQGVGLYHSSWVTPSSEGDFHHRTGHSDGTPFTLATEDYEYNQFKPSVGRTQTMETMHHWSPPQSSFTHSPSFDSLDWVDGTNYELGKLQKGQKWLSSNPYQYNSERVYQHQDASDPEPDSVIFSPGYQTQKLTGQDAGSHVVDGKGKFAKLFINVESGDDSIDGQTYFTTQNANEYPLKWTGKNMAEADIKNSNPYVNLQVSVNKNSLKQGHDPHYGDKPLSHVQIPCLDGVGECSPKPEKHWPPYNVPEQFNYSPFAEATAVSIPRRPFQQALSESSPHRLRSALGVQQYRGKPQQLAYHK